MKKNGLIILFAMVCSLLVSCNQQTHNDVSNIRETEAQTYSEETEKANVVTAGRDTEVSHANTDEIKTEAYIADDTENSIASETETHTVDNTESLTASENESSSNEVQDDDVIHQGPPAVIPFDTLEDIKDLLSVAWATPEQFEKYKQEKFPSLLIYQNYAQDAAKVIPLFDLPTIKNSSKIEFGGTYYAEDQSFDCRYKIDGVLYTFAYRHKKLSLRENESVVALKDQKFGSSTIDIYKGDGYLVGVKSFDGYNVRVVIFTDDASKVSFDIFEFEKIQGNISE